MLLDQSHKKKEINRPKKLKEQLQLKITMQNQKL